MKPSGFRSPGNPYPLKPTAVGRSSPLKHEREPLLGATGPLGARAFLIADLALRSAAKLANFRDSTLLSACSCPIRSCATAFGGTTLRACKLEIFLHQCLPFLRRQGAGNLQKSKLAQWKLFADGDGLLADNLLDLWVPVAVCGRPPSLGCCARRTVGQFALQGTSPRVPYAAPKLNRKLALRKGTSAQWWCPHVPYV
uniref:Uncharacterized protein n=1 Tax=Trichuris muris TaxID=70415 RepID=A0A5S6QCR4_TRIMR